MNLTIDIKDGNRLRRTRDGDEYDRIAIVGGLTFADARALNQALEAPGMPRLGEPHPARPSAKCVEQNLESVGGGSATIRLVYQTPGIRGGKTNEAGETSVEVGSTVEEEEIDTDYNGNLLLVEYKDGDGHWHKDYVTTTVGRPLSRLIVRRQEMVCPLEKSKFYTGKINSSAWMGGAAWTWRCDGIVGPSSDGGKTWDVTYTFTYNARTWIKMVAYLDPETGRKPVTPPVVSGKGIRQYDVYDMANFGALGLRLTAAQAVTTLGPFAVPVVRFKT